ncbi:hypothetical protein DTW90_32665 [Neorhizobium sp. P12A]|jgi:hypothetical protein|uniref:hypothetical protein n=1 Tax=Rhizobium/Agrobacterium group TaxID=227290 RepID=UPI001043DE3D|nr:MULTISPECIES: hypothetical protein [Rhizobium/Agrobacterium group]KAA0688158.1 hypothetical protein DTW90_32665 [Neorhizobium sp. P12A]TCR72220.1 hypothetical protein EV561_13045 [Rhizobium sp. BK376]
MTDQIDEDPIGFLLDVLRQTRSQMRVSEMLSGQVLMRLAMLTEDPKGFVGEVTFNIERDLKFVASEVEPDDKFNAAEIEGSLDYLAQLRSVFDSAIEAARTQRQ